MADQIPNMTSLIRLLEEREVEANDLLSAVEDEKLNEAIMLIEDGLLEVCRYLVQNGWSYSAIVREAGSPSSEGD